MASEYLDRLKADELANRQANQGRLAAFGNTLASQRVASTPVIQQAARNPAAPQTTHFSDAARPPALREQTGPARTTPAQVQPATTTPQPNIFQQMAMQNGISNLVSGGSSAATSTGAMAAPYSAATTANMGAQAAQAAGQSGTAMSAADSVGATSGQLGNLAATQGAASAGGTPLFAIGKGSYAGYAGATNDALGAFNMWNDQSVPSKDKASRTQQQIGLGVADAFTGGLTGMAVNALKGTGFGQTLDKYGTELDRRTNPASILANKLGIFGGQERFKEEYKRAQALRDKGVKWDLNATEPTAGRTSEQMANPNVAPDFIGYDANGLWTNNKFNTSRDVADLQPQDIWGYTTFGEKFGNDWLNAPEQSRYNIGKKLLESGAVTEHNGTVDVKWTPELDAYAKQQLAKPDAVPYQYAPPTAAAGGVPAMPGFSISFPAPAKTLPPPPNFGGNSMSLLSFLPQRSQSNSGGEAKLYDDAIKSITGGR